MSECKDCQAYEECFAKEQEWRIKYQKENKILTDKVDSLEKRLAVYKDTHELNKMTFAQRTATLWSRKRELNLDKDTKK